MKEKYPFVNFTFNLIFKGKVQAQLQTGTKKSIFPFAWKQTEITNFPGCYIVKNQIFKLYIVQ